MKELILFLVLIIISYVSQGISKSSQRENEVDDKTRRHRSTRFPKACSTANIDVRLEKTEFDHDYNKGIVRVALPRSPHPVRLCFPTNMQEHAQVFHLSHAICRQLGFMTLEEVREQRISLDGPLVAEGGGNDTSGGGVMPLLNLKSSSWSCRGYEQTVAQCDWNQIEVDPCPQITELTCGDCRKTFKEFEGLIRTPGYPAAHLYQLSCEWRIEVPEGNTVYLVFDHFSAPPMGRSAFECAADKPYIEVIYGVQEKFSFSRYCNFRQLLNLSVPFNTLTIRYFSGLYNPRALRVQEKVQGLAISFRAVPATSYSTLWWLLVILVVVVILIAISGASCYHCRGRIQKLMSLRGTGPPPITPPNMPSREDLERAYDFQRCHIQGDKDLKPGLRLRSTGSRSRLSNVFYPVSSASDYLATTLRKLSMQSSTPLSTIAPHSYSNEQYCDDGKLLMLSKCKTNLQDRLASRSCSDSSVFLPVEVPPQPTFHIYHSTSSDTRPEPTKPKIQQLCSETPL